MPRYYIALATILPLFVAVPIRYSSAMRNTAALYALKRLHADISGRILKNRQDAKKLAADAKHVEAVIRMIRPDFDMRSIAARRRYKTNPNFRRGEIVQRTIDTLRHADSAMSAHEITDAVLASRGIARTPGVVRALFDGVRASLQNHEGRTVERVSQYPIRWRLKGDAGQA